MKFDRINAAEKFESETTAFVHAMERRAELLARMTKMRAMLNETRNKSAELKQALERFKQRQTRLGAD
jgi:uncharacterized protein YukE